MEQLRGQNRAFELHLCVKQVAELVGDILAVADDSCRFVDGSELRKTIRCVVVADGVNGDIHKFCAQGTPSIVACDLGGEECAD